MNESINYFETVKCEDYEIFNLFYHNKRISDTIALNIDLNEYIYPPNNKLLRCKIIYDESGVLRVDYFEYKKRDIKNFKIVFDDKIDYSKKYLDRTCIDNLFLQKGIADEIIIIKDNLVADTSIANIAIYEDGLWFTPKSPLLKGTIRQKLLDEKKIFKKDIELSDLKKASKIALMNAMIEFDIYENYSFLS